MRQTRQQRGSSMIEVLIALTLVAVTMLGLLGLQLRSMGQQKDSIDRRTAAVLVAGFAERMTANFGSYEARSYNNLVLNPPGSQANGTLPALPNCATSNACTAAADIAARDWALFAAEVRNRLPEGVAFVDTPADLTRATITVGWIDPTRVEANESPGNVTNNLVNRDPACPNTAEFDPQQNPGNARYRCYRAAAMP